MRDFWRRHPEIVVLSISGGVRDLTVPPYYTNIREIRKENTFHIYTTGIKNLYLEADHLATVWGIEFFDRLCDVFPLLFERKPIQDIIDVLESDYLRVLYSKSEG